MKKIRYIPYGYTMRNGRTVISTEEAEIIREIFKAYLDGASLKAIAEELTGRPPLQGQADPARQAEGAIVAPGGGVELQRHEDVQPLPPADAGADLPASAAEPMPDASEALPPLDDASAAQ